MLILDAGIVFLDTNWVDARMKEIIRVPALAYEQLSMPPRRNLLNKKNIADLKINNHDTRT
jgi:hypothetical protein